MQEPSILDYIKSLFDPRRPRIQIPWDDDNSSPDRDERGEDDRLTLREMPTISTANAEETAILPEAEVEPSSTPLFLARRDETTLESEHPFQPASSNPEQRARWPWLALSVLTLALLAQSTLEPPSRNWQTGGTLYLVGAALLAWAYFRNEWHIAPLPRATLRRDPLTVQRVLLIAALPLTGIAFLTMGGNRFTNFNVTVWLLAFVCLIGGLWLPNSSLKDWWRRAGAWLSHPHWVVQITPWTLLVFGGILLSLFFRFYQLNGVPTEMISDHAEKLLDVQDVLNGQYSIFFPRNTGREPFQFYLTAAIIESFGTGISFLSLKLGTVTSGVVTLIFMYLLGVEVGNRRVGFLAMVFTGIAYWPNVISRFALRFAFYPLFAAPTIYYLVRGIRRQSRNDFILAGICLGLGLHGYSSFRVVPVLVVVAAVLFALHHISVLRKPWFWFGFVSLVAVSIAVFLPLLRFITESPENYAAFSYRFLSRVSDQEQTLPGPAGQIFMQNLWRGVTMMVWDDGETWVHSVVHRPALDVVSAALYQLGVVLLLIRYVTRRNWLDLFWLVSIPILMLPSILSLAFPAENPSLNRPGGAYIPVFLIMALALDGLMTGIEKGLNRSGSRMGGRVAWTLFAVLLLWSSRQNYNLVFKEYANNFLLSARNSSEIGAVMRGFVESGIGKVENTWVVIYPHWVDTRLTSINAGQPYRESGMAPEDVIPFAKSNSETKMFILNPQAFDVIQELQTNFPNGLLIPYQSKVETKDFWIYFVPGNTP